MYVNDPIADMLTRIRNANMVYHESVDIPISKMKLGIAKILKSEGYIRNYKVLNDPKKPSGTIKVFLNYGPNRERVVQGLRRMSKPGRRIYVGKDKLPRVMGGLGIAIVLPPLVVGPGLFNAFPTGPFSLLIVPRTRPLRNWYIACFCSLSEAFYT